MAFSSEITSRKGFMVKYILLLPPIELQEKPKSPFQGRLQV